MSQDSSLELPKEQESPFELPKATEKLSYKFILDTLRDRKQEEASQALEGATLEITPSINHAIPTEESMPSEEALLQTEVAETMPSSEALRAETMAPSDASGNEMLPFTPITRPLEKKYFRIGEVSELMGVEAYVLRYWESEFKLVKPTKSGSGHRVYSRRDVETLYQIKHLLHVEKFSIKGAKQKLLERRREGQAATKAKTGEAPQNRKLLKTLQQELKELIQVAKHF